MFGCSGSGDASGATPPPKSSGIVWEVDSASNRATAPGAMVAFANGLHVVVIDGTDIYAGMTKLPTEAAPNGGRVVKLSNGETATFTPSGAELNVTFSSGESVQMHPRPLRNGAGS